MRAFAPINGICLGGIRCTLKSLERHSGGIYPQIFTLPHDMYHSKNWVAPDEWLNPRQRRFSPQLPYNIYRKIVFAAMCLLSTATDESVDTGRRIAVPREPRKRGLRQRRDPGDGETMSMSGGRYGAIEGHGWWTRRRRRRADAAAMTARARRMSTEGLAEKTRCIDSATTSEAQNAAWGVKDDG